MTIQGSGGPKEEVCGEFPGLKLKHDCTSEATPRIPSRPSQSGKSRKKSRLPPLRDISTAQYECRLSYSAFCSLCSALAEALHLHCLHPACYAPQDGHAPDVAHTRLGAAQPPHMPQHPYHPQSSTTPRRRGTMMPHSEKSSTHGPSGNR